MDEVTSLLIALGGIAALRFAYSVLSFLYSAFLRSGPNVKKLGSWAMVTVSFLGRVVESAHQNVSELYSLSCCEHFS